MCKELASGSNDCMYEKQSLKIVGNLYWIKILVIITFVHGVILYIFRTHRSQLSWDFFRLSEYLPYFAGYVFAVLIGRLGIKPIRDIVWLQFYKIINQRDKEPLMFFLSSLLGSSETTVYITALILQKAEFIAAWLAIKVVIQWKGWSEGNIGREIANSYLINSLLAVIYSIAGWYLIEWYYAANDWGRVFALPLTMWIISWIIYSYLKRSIKIWENTVYKEWVDSFQEKEKIAVSE